ncbi:MAG: hypothetical protein LBL39_05040 [Planctomycetaceae bacterium]|nr:hypothetical protein [Planctomycetaceae bacterium]
MGRDVQNRRCSAAQPPDQKPQTTKPCKGEMCLRRSEEIATAETSIFYNLAPAGLERVWGAIRRLRYRSTAGYAHLAPCGAKENVL